MLGFMEKDTRELFENFNRFYYPELKSFAISYLTLVTTILVFSITFAEKVILPNENNRKYSIFLFAAWFMFFISIIFGGYGLWRLFSAYNIANDWYYLYDNNSPSMEYKIHHFKAIYSTAYGFLNYSGLAFVIGMLFLVTSGLLRLLKRKVMMFKLLDSNNS
jgi:H+/Cl- antiporter ClcA